MKKWLCVLLLPALLLGCSKQEILETVSDQYLLPCDISPQQFTWEIPKSATVKVVNSEETGTIYFCDGYAINLQVLQGGDLDRTLQAVTGYERDRLRPMETATGEYRRYDCTWTTTGEEESQIGRTAVLDDGYYHYVLTCMTTESEAQGLQQTWNDLFRSFTMDTAP